MSILDEHIESTLVVLVEEERGLLNTAFSARVCQFEQQRQELLGTIDSTTSYGTESYTTQCGDFDVVWHSLDRRGGKPWSAGWGGAIHRGQKFKYPPSCFRKAAPEERALIEEYELQFAIIRKKLSLLQEMRKLASQYVKLSTEDPGAEVESVAADRA